MLPFASIDIGSNAVRLLISTVTEQNGSNQVFVKKNIFVRVPLRLGMDVFRTGYISEEKIIELVKTINAFKLLMDVHYPVSFEACATAAMREAQNSAIIVKKIFEQTSIPIRIIDGKEEARIIGATTNIPVKNKYRLSMFVDVGGGSTEISILENNKLIDTNSFAIGTVKLLNDKVLKETWKNMKYWLKTYKNQFGKIYAIGTGGNINKLVKLYGNREEKELTYNNIKRACEVLSNYKLDEKIHSLKLRPDRADVIEPAAYIYKKVMKWAKLDFIYVPKIGLSDGLIHDQYKKYKEQQKIDI